MSISDEMLETLKRKFDPGISRVAADTAIPEVWQGYTSESEAERLFEVRQELALIRDYFPTLVDSLSPIIIDAFLVQSSTYGLCRIFVRQLRGSTYFTFSRAPTGFGDVQRMPIWPLYRERAPEALRWVHENVMDGLTDIYGFGGFVSSGMMRPMERPNGNYGELPWYSEFAEDVDASQIVEILRSGGGGYLLIDLNTDLSKTFEPQAMFVDFNADPQDTLAYVPLFPYLDEWMSIALAESDFD